MRLSKNRLIDLITEYGGEDVNLEEVVELYNRGIKEKQSKRPLSLFAEEDEEIVGIDYTKINENIKNSQTCKHSCKNKSMDLFDNTKSVYSVDSEIESMLSNKRMKNTLYKGRVIIDPMFNRIPVGLKLIERGKAIKEWYAPYVKGDKDFKYYLSKNPILLKRKRAEALTSNMIARYGEYNKNRVGTFYNYFCMLTYGAQDIIIREYKSKGYETVRNHEIDKSLDHRKYLSEGSKRLKILIGDMESKYPKLSANTSLLVGFMNLCRLTNYLPEQCAYAILRSFRTDEPTRNIPQYKLYNKLIKAYGFITKINEIIKVLLRSDTKSPLDRYAIEVCNLIKKAENNETSVLELCDPLYSLSRKSRNLNKLKLKFHKLKQVNDVNMLNSFILNYNKKYNTKVSVNSMESNIENQIRKVEKEYISKIKSIHDSKNIEN